MFTTEVGLCLLVRLPDWFQRVGVQLCVFVIVHPYVSIQIGFWFGLDNYLVDLQSCLGHILDKSNLQGCYKTAKLGNPLVDEDAVPQFLVILFNDSQNQKFIICFVLFSISSYQTLAIFSTFIHPGCFSGDSGDNLLRKSRKQGFC